VLVLDQHPLLPTAAVIRDALADLENRLRREGAQVSRRAEGLPDFAATAALQMELMMAQFSADVPDAAYAAARTAASGLEGRSDPQAASLRGQALSHRDWILADRRRQADRAAWARVFQVFDVVLCPAMPTAAFAHDARPMHERTLTIDGVEVPYAAQSLWGTLATVCGLPATAAPLGLTPDRLPIGAQVIGPWLEDLTPLAFAEALERAFGGFQAPPLTGA
jgi:amidase